MRDVLLVHGLWHGAWSWDAVVAGLRERGVRVRALDLPMRTLDGDADVVRAALDEATAPVLLVGHSYGGAVITAAGDHPSVARLVYVAAFALTEDESISRVADHRAKDTGAFVVDGDDITLNPDVAEAVLHHRAPDGTTAEALARMRPAGRALFSGRPPASAWRNTPSTYVVCADDRMVEPALQRVMAARCEDVREWDSDHSPQASRPADLVELLTGLAQQPGPAGPD